jgi:hypothetical protein
MTAKKNSLVFLILIISCILMVPVFLSCPAAGDPLNEAVAITGNIPLVTYNVSVSGIDWTNAIITWNTNGNANSTVDYGTTTSYGSSSTDGDMAENHTISPYNLTPGTVYHFIVISADLFGNSATSPDSTFTTTAIPTVTPTAHGGGGGGGSNSRTNTLLAPGAPQLANPIGQQLLAPLEQLLSRPLANPASNPGIPASESGNSPSGPIFNINGQAALLALLAGIIALLAVIAAYFGWWKKQL